MSSTPRKAPLKKISAPQGWIITQKKAGGLKAWADFGGKKKSAEGEAAEQLLKEARQLGALEKEIPESWMALPTGLDIQVHLRHPGQPHKETLEGGLESALLGGYDSIVSMPNTNPFLDTAAALKAAQDSSEALSREYPVRIGFAASATKGMQGQEAADIGALAAVGAVAITDDGWGVKSDLAQEEIFAACEEHDLLFQQHAEMPGHKGVTPAGPFQQKHSLPEYPRSAESEMIRRDISLLRKHPGARYHVLHVSTKESLAEIRKAKAEGLRVTCEVTPHHLIFSNHDIPEPSDPRCTYFKMNPPLFGPEDRSALREALRDGTIDCVSTDHAPHETHLKADGWIKSPFGTRGLETALPALLTLVAKGELSFERAVEVFSTAPRKVLGLFPEPTGMLFVDPSLTYTVTKEELPGVSENSCFLGADLTGRIEIRTETGWIYVRH
jgi:dihydroorotase